MKKVYLVKLWGGDDFFTIAAYSTRELADLHVTIFDPEDLEVEEFELDLLAERLRPGVQIWWIKMGRDGEVIYAEQARRSSPLVGFPYEVGLEYDQKQFMLVKHKEYPWYLYGCVLATSRESAIIEVQVERERLRTTGQWEGR